MTDPFVTPGGSPFFGTIRCASVHEFTLRNDWSVEFDTPDANERIALALSGTCDCQEILAREVRTVRSVMPWVSRRSLFPMTFRSVQGARQWEIEGSTGCCPTYQSFYTAHEAAEHFLSAPHVYGTLPTSTRLLEDAKRLHLGDREDFWHRLPLDYLHDHCASVAGGNIGWVSLWNAGVHPEVALPVIQQLRREGHSPVPVEDILVTIYSDTDGKETA